METQHKETSYESMYKEDSSAGVDKVFVAEIETLADSPPSREVVLVDTVRSAGQKSVSRAFPLAAKSSKLHFDPRDVNAAIVTCGGLCPGLNNVIREITNTLHRQYRVHQVWGIQGGWLGFYAFPPLLLTPETVHTCHHSGGSFLKTSRGGLDLDKTVAFLRKYQISHLYILGGDGTHRGAYKVHQKCRELNIDVAVVGIPKTIDNDIDYMDRSFGFYSAVEAAQASIRTALIEARCTVPNGIGVIKLMGREAGFLAAFAALGSGGDVDAVLIPEEPIVLEGPGGILPFLHRRVLEKQHAVVVVAEGAGQELLENVQEKEAGSGNKILPPIAEYVCDEIKAYFKGQGMDCRMKFVDPSYSVRSVPANAADALYCTQLGQAAVHGAMAGSTGFSVGMVNNRIVYIPIPLLVATSPRFLNPKGDIWERVLDMTGQPIPPSAANKVQSSEENSNNMFPELPEPSAH
jgi:6-phosphofructokinase 1